MTRRTSHHLRRNERFDVERYVSGRLESVKVAMWGRRTMTRFTFAGFVDFLPRDLHSLLDAGLLRVLFDNGKCVLIFDGDRS